MSTTPQDYFSSRIHRLLKSIYILIFLLPMAAYLIQIFVMFINGYKSGELTSAWINVGVLATLAIITRTVYLFVAKDPKQATPQKPTGSFSDVPAYNQLISGLKISLKIFFFVIAAIVLLSFVNTLF